MEKLQIAIEKARASRLAQKAGMPQEQHAQEAVLQEADKADAWAALPEMHLATEMLDRNRIVAYQNGPNSTYYDILRTRLRDEAKRRGYKRIAVTSTRPPRPASSRCTACAIPAISAPSFAPPTPPAAAR